MTTGSNAYIFTDLESDRYRLARQAELFANQLRRTAPQYAGQEVESILDLGCGDGQLGMTLREAYPNARLVGIDKDEQAIAKARDTAAERGLTNCEFIVTDLNEGLPAGSFDLILASYILTHVRDTQQMLRTIYAALNAGGHLWIREANPKLRDGFDSESFRRLADMFYGAIQKMGGHPDLVNRLPEMMTAAGFDQIKEEQEVYVMGGPSADGKVTMGVVVGLFYGSRQWMAKMAGVPVDEVERLYVQVLNDASSQEQAVGQQIVPNIIARRPLTERR